MTNTPCIAVTRDSFTAFPLLCSLSQRTIYSGSLALWLLGSESPLWLQFLPERLFGTWAALLCSSLPLCSSGNSASSHFYPKPKGSCSFLLLLNLWFLSPPPVWFLSPSITWVTNPLYSGLSLRSRVISFFLTGLWLIDQVIIFHLNSLYVLSDLILPQLWVRRQYLRSTNGETEALRLSDLSKIMQPLEHRIEHLGRLTQARALHP